MRNLFKSLSIVSKGLRYKLLIAFTLMSIIPLMALVYLVINYIFPQLDTPADISLVVLFSILISNLGFLLVKRLLEPVIEMAAETNVIANGNYDRRIMVSSEDELGKLADSINLLSKKIKTNLEELKSYGQKTREINIDINRKVIVLSNLLQLSDMISMRTMELKGILDTAVSKIAQLSDEGFGVIFLAKDKSDIFTPAASYNLKDERLDDMVVKEGEGVLGRAIFARATLVADSAKTPSKDIEAFKRDHKMKNVLACPIYSGKDTFGVLVVGNRLEEYVFSKDDIDTVLVFAKQVAIAVENEFLIKKTKELAVEDELTGLYNRNYILPRLDEEINRAIFYQRPCSFLAFNIDGSKKFRDLYGEIAFEEALKRIADLLKKYIAPFGKAARTGGDEFVLLLPEKNKREAMSVAEEIRGKVEGLKFGGAKNGPKGLTVSVGVSENPIDGSTKDDIFKKAMDAVSRAKTEGKNRVIG